MGSRRGRTWCWVTASLLAALGMVGCGSSEGYNGALGAPAPPGTELAAAGLYHYQAVAPLAPSVVTTAPRGGRDAVFCQDVAQLQGLAQILVTPFQGATALDQARSLIQRLPLDAPAAIRPAAMALARSVDQIVSDIRSSPPNLSDLAAVTTSFQASLQEVLVFAAVHC